MKYSLNSKLRLLFITLFVISCLAANVYCVLTVDPEAQRIDIRPGKKAKACIYITNNSDRVLRMKTHHEIKTAQGKFREDGCRGIRIKVKPKRFKLKPGRTKKVKVVAKTKKDIKDTHVSKVLFITKDIFIGETKIGVKLGSIIYWKAKETENRKK